MDVPIQAIRDSMKYKMLAMEPPIEAAAKSEARVETRKAVRRVRRRLPGSRKIRARRSRR